LVLGHKVLVLVLVLKHWVLVLFFVLKLRVLVLVLVLLIRVLTTSLQITPKDVHEFRWNSGAVGCVTSNSWLDFASDPAHDVIQEFLKEFLPLWDRGNCMNCADRSRSCRRILIKFLRVSLEEEKH